MLIEIENDTHIPREDLEKTYGTIGLDKLAPDKWSGLIVYSSRSKPSLPGNDIVILSFCNEDRWLVRQLMYQAKGVKQVALATIDRSSSELIKTGMIPKLGKFKIEATTDWEYYDVDYTNPLSGERLGMMTRAVKKEKRRKGRGFRPSDCQMIIGKPETGEIGTLENVVEVRDFTFTGRKKHELIEYKRLVIVGDHAFEYFTHRGNLIRQISDSRTLLSIETESGLTDIKPIPYSLGKASFLRF